MKAWNKVGAPFPHPKENAPQRLARPGRFCVQGKRLLLIGCIARVFGYDQKKPIGIRKQFDDLGAPKAPKTGEGPGKQVNEAYSGMPASYIDAKQYKSSKQGKNTYYLE